MSNVRYKPRLKKGIFKSKRYVIVGKDLKKLKKQKWRSFLKSYVNTSFLEPLVRNDVHLIHNRTLDLRKEYSRALLHKRQVSSFFSTFKGKALRNIFSSNRKKSFLHSPLNSLLDSIELRLDTVLLRSNLVKTLHQARWLVASGFVSINGKVVRIISYKLSVGDFVQIKKTFSPKESFFSFSTFNLPSVFMEVNYETLSLVITDLPSIIKKEERIKLYPFFLGLEEIANFNKVN